MIRCDVVIRLSMPNACGQPAVAEPAVLWATHWHKPMVLPRFCLEHEREAVRWGLPTRGLR